MSRSDLFEQRTFTYGEHSLAYEVHGRGGPAVVLIHGLLMDANMNRALARSLAAHGYQVLLLDLLGHGRSTRAPHATAHRMDLYALQVVALLDEMGIDRAVVGGASLGADVSLQVAVAAPDRVQGLIAEMPVLEAGVPVAALLFVPLLLTLHYLHPVFRAVSRLAGRVPRPGLGPLDSVIELVSSDPDGAAAVLHGVLLGPVAPTLGQRAAIAAPTLVIGHRGDPLHAFADARNLARQIPRAELIEARSFAELRWAPDRLTRAISGFVDRAWRAAPGPGLEQLRSG